MLRRIFVVLVTAIFMININVFAAKHIKMIDPAVKIERQHKKNLRNLSVWRKKRLKRCETVKNKDSCVSKTEEIYMNKKEFLTKQYLERKNATESQQNTAPAGGQPSDEVGGQ